MTATATPAPPAATSRSAGLRAALARRWPTAAGLAATAAGLAVLTPLPAQARTWASAWCLLLAAVVYLTWGTARGDLGDRRLLSAQTVAVLGFGAVAIATVDPDAVRYVLAAGWIAHAAWDVAHHRIGRVVPRWYAEACLVTDLSIAAVLLIVGLV